MSHPVAPAPTQTPPPPLNALPPRTTRQQDRFSYSSTLTTSTSSGSSTLSALLVSPTTPTKPEWTWTAVVTSPVQESVDCDDEQYESASWAPRTPTMGGHLGVPGESAVVAGMNDRGDTTKWWAGTTPTNAKPQLGRIDTSMDTSRNIFGLQSSPVDSNHGSPSSCEAAVHESPIMPALNAVLLRTPRGSGEWAPATPPALDDDSPTLGYDEFPFPPLRPAPTLPTVPLEQVLQRIERERALAEWSPKRLGKLPAILFETQPETHSQEDDASHIPNTQNKLSRARPSSPVPSSRSSSSVRSQLSSVSAPPRIPKRSSSRADLKADASAQRAPPVPPTRGSSLKPRLSGKVSGSSSTSALGSLLPSAQFPLPPSSLRLTASNRKGLPRSFSAPTNLHQRSRTSSSSFSTLETVLEAPGDLQDEPDGTWALRPRTAGHRLHRSHSLPNVEISAPEMMERFMLKRSESNMSIRAGADSNRPRRRLSIAGFSTLSRRTGPSALSEVSEAHTPPASTSPKPKKAVTFRKTDRLRPSMPSLPGWGKASTSRHQLAPAPAAQPIRSILSPSRPIANTPPHLELSYIPSRPAPRPPTGARPTPREAMDIFAEHLRRDSFTNFYDEALDSLHAVEGWSWPEPPSVHRPACAGSPTITASGSFSTFGGPLTPPASSAFSYANSLVSATASASAPTTQLGCAISLDKEVPSPELDVLHGEVEYEANERERARKQMYGKYGAGDEVDSGSPFLSAAQTAEAYRSRRRSLAPAWAGQAF